MKVIINMNETVKVKLTEYGKEILRLNHDDIFGQYVHEFKLPKEDENGYCEFQLWELFKEFGKKTFMGCRNCFENEIIFEKKL